MGYSGNIVDIYMGHRHVEKHGMAWWKVMIIDIQLKDDSDI